LFRHLARYLGRPVAELLRASPFCEWRFARSVDEELGSIDYEFDEQGFDLLCDEHDLVRTIFVKRGGAEYLLDVPLTAGRAEVLARFGTPESSRPASKHPVFGELGPSDRFIIPGGLVHFEYRADAYVIKMITLMRADAAP